MNIVGIISEYNPFHSGHRYQLTELRRHFGPDCGLVCVMSGNWVQRGTCAITDKWCRAEMALRGGADLVLELPTFWAVSSAETFARGGTALLDSTGIVDTLCFGSEAGSLAPLQQAAQALESPLWQQGLREALDKGLSFPAARQKAAETLLGDSAQLLSAPNNNLGIEYLRALKNLKSRIEPFTIQRLGADHDTHDTGTPHVSASYLREKLLAQPEPALSPFLTDEDVRDIRQDPASLTFCRRAVLARLRTMEEEDFSRLPDSGEGLGRKLFLASRQAASLEEVYTLTKSKRYTHARIRRMVLWAFLGLTETDRPEKPPYLRVLGFSPVGQELLKKMKPAASLPVVVKPAHVKKLSPEARRVFDLEARSTGLYDLCRKHFETTPGKQEYRQSPVILSSMP